MKSEIKDYFLGLDVGTDSVGWAVADDKYNLLKFNSKTMWGVHLFDSGETAEKRRGFRGARRRSDRKTARLNLLQELFASEISKKDFAFFERLEDSKFYTEDKNIPQTNTLFNDKDYKDKDFHKEYPTIYHLRQALVYDKKTKFDIRLIYLAVHHIIKHRGHFIYEGKEFKIGDSFDSIFEDALASLRNIDIDFSVEKEDYKKISDILKSKDLSITDKKKELSILLNSYDKGYENKDQRKIASDLLCGAKVSLETLFLNDSYDKTKLSFKETTDEAYAELTALIEEENLDIIEKLKAVYDWSVLAAMIKDKIYLCDAKVEMYDQHKNDLKQLKELFKNYDNGSKFNEVFKDNKENNYCAYSNASISDKKDSKVKKCSQENFCDFVKKIIEKYNINTDNYKDLVARINNSTAFPKQVSSDNGVIPYQLHLNELKEILNNAEKHYDFLNEKDEYGTVSDKVLKIMTFRIPYYVGPLNAHSDFAWIIRKKEGKINPWNFDEKVDKEESATAFIERMTNKCTYLVGENVIPKNSILYSKFVLLNQINNIKINDQKMGIVLKQELFNDLFLNIDVPKKITVKGIKAYLISKNFIDKKSDVIISGIDVEIKGSMKPYLDFKKIFGDNMPNEEIIEEAIKKITVLGSAGNTLKNAINDTFNGIATKEQIEKITRLSYSGWGRFSKTFLTDICIENEYTGEAQSIISMMWQTDNNLMQLLSNEYDYLKKIEDFNKNVTSDDNITLKEQIDNLYCSPSVKRSILRTLMITKEIAKVTKREPKKIFIEMARDIDNSQKGQRTTSRKDFLKNAYKNCKKLSSDIFNADLTAILEKTQDINLRQKKLFLYYTQFGKCMYSGEPINLEELFTKEYDIDHIYPQCKVKDNSIDNMVLVKKDLNAKKSDKFPIPNDCVTNKAKELWRVLLEKGLISKEKHHRLTRTNGFSGNELSGFIARQLVETRQSTKAIAKMLETIYSESKIVYVKAGNVSEFRRDEQVVKCNDGLELVKCRIVNDYHHAKDAYLNIVVGNVYDVKFTSNPINFIKSKQTYSLNKVFNFNVQRNNEIAWISDNNETLINVLKNANSNNVLYTRYATCAKGGFYNQNPISKGEGKVLLPLKSSDERLHDISKYGGYKNESISFYVLVEHDDKKGNKQVTFEGIPVRLLSVIKKDDTAVNNYLKNTLKLLNHKILIDKIKINTLFNVDGFKMHLAGKSGDKLIVKGANQLIISNDLYYYVKKIESYINKNKELKTEVEINVNKGITKEKNLALYDEMTRKLRYTIYIKKLSVVTKPFVNNREVFENLSLINQCKFLYEAFRIFGTSSTGKDLSLINGSKGAGIVTISKNL
ncbi:MAG: type II CRISPR RNA-guided endonuclease Cas9, partial [Clostridia bacterium]